MKVRWKNGETNSYRTEDLEIVTKLKTTITKEHLIELSAFFLIKGQLGIKYTKEEIEQMMIKKLKQICK